MYNDNIDNNKFQKEHKTMTQTVAIAKIKVKEQNIEVDDEIEQDNTETFDMRLCGWNQKQSRNEREPNKQTGPSERESWLVENGKRILLVFVQWLNAHHVYRVSNEYIVYLFSIPFCFVVHACTHLVYLVA